MDYLLWILTDIDIHWAEGSPTIYYQKYCVAKDRRLQIYIRHGNPHILPDANMPHSVTQKRLDNILKQDACRRQDKRRDIEDARKPLCL